MYHPNLYYFKAKKIGSINKYNLWRGVARKIKLSEKGKLRLEWIIFYHTAAKSNASLTAQHFGISRSLFYFWFKRFRENNLKSLEDNKSSPKRIRKWNPDPLILNRMIKLRKKHIHWSKLKLAVLYQNIYQEPISSWQFQRVITEFNLYPERKKKNGWKKNGAKKQLISYDIRQSAKYLYSIDTKVLWLFGLRYYLIMAVGHDDKIAYARAYRSHSSKQAADFLDRLNYLLDGKIEIILTDNGSEFMKDFNIACREKSLKRYWSRPRTPKDNPEVERLIKTYIYEYLNDGHWSGDIKILNSYLTEWLIEYNTVRPHEKLNYLTPLQYAEQTGLLSKMGSSST